MTEPRTEAGRTMLVYYPDDLDLILAIENEARVQGGPSLDDVFRAGYEAGKAQADFEATWREVSAIIATDPATLEQYRADIARLGVAPEASEDAPEGRARA